MNFYYCEQCGSLMVEANKVEVKKVCCGEEMQLLEAGTTDAAVEKHVPEITRDGNKVDVVVGSTPHPMEEDHFIESIVAVQGDNYQVVRLNPGDEPKASFTVEDGPVEVYEFCNLHGLWKAEA